MHELSLCQAIAGVVRPYAVDKHIVVVRVQVGALRQVVPDSLTFCWDLIRDYEAMPDAVLELEMVPAEVFCRSCGSRRCSHRGGRCAVRHATAETSRWLEVTSSR